MVFKNMFFETRIYPLIDKYYNTDFYLIPTIRVVTGQTFGFFLLKIYIHIFTINIKIEWFIKTNN